MILSRILLDTRSAEARRWLASPQVMHARILRQIGRDDPGRVLWRTDQTRDGFVELYVATAAPWDGQPMAGEAGSLAQGWRTATYAPLLERLGAGQRWVFRLTANPTVSVAGPHGTRGKVVPHVTAVQQQAWLHERASRIGIDVGPDPETATYRVVDRRRLQFRRRADSPGGAGGQVSLSTATYEGLLTITEPDLLRSAMTEGIGRARAYGCGLLTLAPPP